MCTEDSVETKFGHFMQFLLCRRRKNCNKHGHNTSTAGISMHAFSLLLEIIIVNNRFNDDRFAALPAVPSSSCQRIAISYFAHAQDYMENMEKHVDNKKWKQWNLEATAKLLERRYPNSFIWVVRPSRYHLSTFACYQNFVEVNMFGVPDHRNHSYGALKHLSSVLESAVKRSK